ncbi:MAG: MinD/ParA family protein [Bacillota bacterium]
MIIRDQAARLRELARKKEGQKTTNKSNLRVIAVASGKGGVGKTNVVLNLAVTLSKMGKRVVILDGDLGLANIDILMGVVPQYTLFEFMRGEKSLDEVMIKGPYDLKVLPAGSGIQEMANLNDHQREKLLEAMRTFEEDADFLLIDTGAGISRTVLGLVSAATEVIIVLTPEPTSLTDAYGVIKILSRFKLHSEVYLVINRVANPAEAEATVSRMQTVVNRFLQIKVRQLGYINDDRQVGKAVMKQQPFTILYPHTAASEDIQQIAFKLLGVETVTATRGIGQFLNRLMRLFG